MILNIFTILGKRVISWQEGWLVFRLVFYKCHKQK